MQAGTHCTLAVTAETEHHKTIMLIEAAGKQLCNIEKAHTQAHTQTHVHSNILLDIRIS